jgi:putative ABC transport system permease protein
MKVATSWLDLKMSLRMLVKYPFVTVVAIIATSFAIGAGGLYFEIASDLIHPTLPLQNADRIVEVHNEDLSTRGQEGRSLRDFTIWSKELKTVRDLAAYTVGSHNLGPVGGAPEPQDVVEIGAGAFRVAHIPPLRGRPLVDADEQDGAPPVVVVGERLWERRFNRDPNLVGKTVEIGRQPYTVVGIMPKSFALPVNHEIWIPFHTAGASYPLGQGPSIGTIGRLAPGATLASAQAELTVLGRRIAAEYPVPNGEQVKPRVEPYLSQFTPDPSESTVRLGVNAIFMLLLAVICANVGALVFARIVTREKEFSVRTALGASRGRIVGQLFVEALMMTGISAVIAIFVVRWALRAGANFLATTHHVSPPFWQDSALSWSTILYVILLAVVGALVMGVLPALKFTRGSIEASLRRSASGGSGLRSRRMSTAVIVTQVALSGAMLPIALTGALKLNWSKPAYPGIRPSEYVAVRYGIEGPADDQSTANSAANVARMDSMQQALKRRVLAEPGFASVTFAQQLPGSTHFRHTIELNGEGGGSTLHNARVATVDADFFQTFKTPVSAGRGFRETDVASTQGVVVVNQPFVNTVLGGRNAVGRRVRIANADGQAPEGEWFEIVGVVPDLGMNPLKPDRSAGMYRLAKPGDLVGGYMAVRIEGSPETAAQKLRTLAAQVDKGFLIYDVRPLDQMGDTELQMDRAFALIIIGGSFFLVMLSAAVTFALMSFTVSQRTREIGIYRALGASSRNVMRSVFSRAFVQLGIGATVGMAVSIFLGSRAPGSSLDPLMVLAVLGVMLMVGVFSCGAPALRALRIEPTIAMKEDI